MKRNSRRLVKLVTVALTLSLVLQSSLTMVFADQKAYNAYGTYNGVQYVIGGSIRHELKQLDPGDILIVEIEADADGKASVLITEAALRRLIKAQVDLTISSSFYNILIPVGDLTAISTQTAGNDAFVYIVASNSDGDPYKHVIRNLGGNLIALNTSGTLTAK